MRAGTFFGITAGVASAAFTTDLTIQTCNQKGCTSSPKRVALDVAANGTEKLISVGGTNKNELTLKYGGSELGGPRVYLIEEDGVNKNTMFMLHGQEFTFDVELSTMSCGFNAALYFVGMPSNDGAAVDGTKYCDAQAVAGTFCSEMDLFEANTEAQQYTTHACVDTCGSFSDATQCQSSGGSSSVCDQSGCGLNPFRYGPGTSYDGETNNDKWYGKGSSFQLDSSQQFTVVTQFYDGNITRFYMQNGKRIDLPTLYVKPPSDGSHYDPFQGPAIREDFCTDIYDRWDGDGGYKPLAQMFKNSENGMVLAMSAWYAQETYVDGKPSGSQTGMSWLDGLNNWGHYTKAGPCDTTTSDAGTHFATFSNIKFGDIGTTLPSTPPSPTVAPVTTQAPTTTTAGPSADCPGGSLQACINMCPSAIYQQCMADCAKRCSSNIMI